MPVISKTSHPVQGDHDYRKIISVDSKGEFMCKLPSIWYGILGYDSIQAETVNALERKFKEAHKAVQEAASTTRRVIVWKYKDNVAFGQGTVISLAANVFDETTVVVNGTVRKNYELVSGTGMPACLRKSFNDGYDRQVASGNKMDYTDERMEFFIKLGAGMDALSKMLGQLGNEERTLSIVDSGQLFLLPQ